MKYLVVLLISVFAFSCKYKSSNNTFESSKKYSDLKQEDKKGISQDEEITDFSIFWSDFRNAITSNDSLTLIKMTNFPLEVKGYEDQDPILKIDEKNFMRVLKIVLMHSSYDITRKEHVTNLELVKRKKTAEQIEYYKQAPNQERLGELEFVKTKNGWRLFRIYLDTNGLQKK